MTIRDFQQLRELELDVTWSVPHQAFFSSITSTKLRKVSFPAWYSEAAKILAEQNGGWALIDKQLCGLVDRLRAAGHRHTLEAELRLMGVGDDPGSYDPGEHDFAQFLPKLREKGVVTVIDTDHGDRLLHSSIRVR